MLTYFEDESLTVIDICYQIVKSHFKFAISVFKRNNSLEEIF